MAEEVVERLRRHTFLDPVLIEAVGKHMTADEYLALPEVIFYLSELMTEGPVYLGPLED